MIKITTHLIIVFTTNPYLELEGKTRTLRKGGEERVDFHNGLQCYDLYLGP